MTGSGAVATKPRRFKRFPPGSGNLWVPLDSRESAMAAISLWPACRASAVWARRLAHAGVRMAGARILPGRSRTWIPPTGTGIWRRLLARWGRDVGAVGSWSVYERPQVEREGFAALLLADGRPRGFAKVRSVEAPVVREWEAMRAARRLEPTSFDVPRPLSTGREEGWHWWLSEPLPMGLHAPPRDPPLTAITAEIVEALEGLPRPEGTPEHWIPMHGDLTPWNLRESTNGLILIDWEDAGWGPPGADEVLYRAVEAALGGELRRVPDAREAIDFWREATDAEGGEARDRRLARGIDEALSWMELRS